MKREPIKQADQNIGLRIRMLRKENGLTNEMLAELTNMSVEYTALICRGDRTPSLKLLMKYSEVFKVSLDFIVYGKSETHDDEAVELEYLNRLPKEQRGFLLKLCKLIFSFNCTAAEFRFLHSMISNFFIMRAKQRHGDKNEL